MQIVAGLFEVTNQEWEFSRLFLFIIREIRMNVAQILAQVNDFGENADVSRQNCVLHPPRRQLLALGLNSALTLDKIS